MRTLSAATFPEFVILAKILRLSLDTAMGAPISNCGPAAYAYEHKALQAHKYRPRRHGPIYVHPQRFFVSCLNRPLTRPTEAMTRKGRKLAGSGAPTITSTL